MRKGRPSEVQWSGWGYTARNGYVGINTSSEADLVFCSLHFSSETPISINYKMLDTAGPKSVLLIATHIVFSNVPVYNSHLITVSCMNVE